MAAAADGLWTRVQGNELVELYENGEDFKTVLPNVQAIYIWKLNLRAPSYVTSSPQAFRDWVATMCTVPMGRTAPINAGQFISMGAIELRSTTVPKEKLSFLKRFLSRPPNRQWLKSFLQGLAQHAPTIYVGETERLPGRIREHVSGASDFGRLVATEPALSWETLDLYYVKLPTLSEEHQTSMRRTLESITSSLTIAGFTRRRG